VLWPDRLSSSTTRLPLLLDEELELLELEELLLEEDELELEELLLDEDELELLLDELLELEELEELLLDDELELEVPEEEELELLLEDELLELEELLLDVGVSPAQVGIAKVPSWVPWKPKALVIVAPGAGS
jgi:hypothetical protein